MKKSKFIKSTIILIIGGFITKILGMVIKIIMTRLLGTEGIGIYMLIMPTFSLFIGLAQFGLPVAISTLVAEDKRNNKNLVFSLIPLSFIINIVIIVLLIFFGRYLSINLIHEPRTYYGLLCIGLVLPFISISSIIRSYFFGKQRMVPHVISNITEDVVRLIVIFIGVPIFLVKGIEYAVAFVVLSNIFSELTSILILFFFLPKNFTISKNDFSINKTYIKDTLNISLPTTGSRLIGNIGYFLEPIILTTILLKIGYSNTFIVTEYGIINGYVMPLLLLPSFFTMAISQALIPVVSNGFVNGNKKYVQNKIKQAIFISLLIGIPITVFFVGVPEVPLKFIYNTLEGIDYLKVIAPIFLLHYIQSPITSSLQAMGKAKDAMYSTFIGMVLRIIIITLLSFLHIGLWGIVVATSFNIIFVTVYNFVKLKNYLK